MGEYAEMDIFARQRGKQMCDLTPKELGEFYREWDNPQPRPPHPYKCGLCGRRLKSQKGLTAHMRDKHAK